MIKKLDLPTQLRRLYAASAGLFAVLAVAAGAMMNTNNYPVTIGHLSKDELASKTSTVFAHADWALFDLEVRWVLVGLLVLSAVVPVLYLTKWAARYQRGMKDRTLTWRWVDLAVTGALMSVVVAVLSGVQDLFVLVVIAGVVAAAVVLATLAERQNTNAKKLSWATYKTGLVLAALPTLLVASYAIATWVYGLVRYPWYVYALYAVLAIGAVLWALNQRRAIKAVGAWKDYSYVERNYAVISLVTKVAFAVVLIVGLMK
ncbi:MAG: conserved hypothetical rane protein [Candidatus Saccharibacteria bacterium]|nr:conserved hypothetical rane protein [Candidatus Saccharibacteria bacterium]